MALSSLAHFTVILSLSAWTFTDHQDSVRDIVSGTGANRGQVVEHRQYDSFGKIVRRTTGPQSTAPATAGVGINFGYAGRPLETRTGLSDNRARWYEPGTGKFINEDPSGFKGGDVNLFRYVGNDPLNQVDPSGLVAETVWDLANLGMGIYSAQDNYKKGNWGWLALDAVGLVYDGVATAVPFLPAGASAGFKAARAGNTLCIQSMLDLMSQQSPRISTRRLKRLTQLHPMSHGRLHLMDHVFTAK